MTTVCHVPFCLVLFAAFGYNRGIDQLWLSIIPTVLGKGVRLFPKLSQELPLKLVGTERWNGIVDLVYEKR